MVTWKQRKRAAEDLQRVMGIGEPVLTHNIKCDDSKLDRWIQEALEHIDPGDTFKDSTVEVLLEAFGFEMPEWDSSGEVEEDDPGEE